LHCSANQSPKLLDENGPLPLPRLVSRNLGTAWARCDDISQDRQPRLFGHVLTYASYAFSAAQLQPPIDNVRRALALFWQRLYPDERGEVLDDAKRSGQPGVRPTRTTDLLAAYMEPTEEPAALQSD
jgi:hypothetical protein